MKNHLIVLGAGMALSALSLLGNETKIEEPAKAAPEAEAPQSSNESAARAEKPRPQEERREEGKKRDGRGDREYSQERGRDFGRERAGRGEGQGRSGFGQGFRPGASLWSKLDADGDGKLSAEEIAQASSVLKALDQDNDGTLTLKESGFFAYGRGDEARRGEMSDDSEKHGHTKKEKTKKKKEKEEDDDDDKKEDDDEDGHESGEKTAASGTSSMSSTVRSWMGFDQNGDGKLTAEELPKKLAVIIEKADADKDGSLSVAELEAHLKASSAPESSTKP